MLSAEGVRYTNDWWRLHDRHVWTPLDQPWIDLEWANHDSFHKISSIPTPMAGNGRPNGKPNGIFITLSLLCLKIFMVALVRIVPVAQLLMSRMGLVLVMAIPFLTVSHQLSLDWESSRVTWAYKSWVIMLLVMDDYMAACDLRLRC